MAASSSERDQWVSDRFVQFVDVVFGVTVAQSFVRYDALLMRPWSDWFSTVALFSVYVVTLFSWMGYHRSMSEYPYAITLTRSWIRMLADTAVVSLYALLLFSVKMLESGPAMAYLDTILVGYAGIFCLYLVSGLARRWERMTTAASRFSALIVMLGLYVALWLAYRHVRYAQLLSVEITNWAFLLLCPTAYLGYRVWRHYRYAPRS